MLQYKQWSVKKLITDLHKHGRHVFLTSLLLWEPQWYLTTVIIFNHNLKTTVKFRAVINIQQKQIKVTFVHNIRKYKSTWLNLKFCECKSELMKFKKTLLIKEFHWFIYVLWNCYTKLTAVQNIFPILFFYLKGERSSSS